jgi:hypothetical protein
MEWEMKRILTLALTVVFIFSLGFVTPVSAGWPEKLLGYGVIGPGTYGGIKLVQWAHRKSGETTDDRHNQSFDDQMKQNQSQTNQFLSDQIKINQSQPNFSDATVFLKAIQAQEQTRNLPKNWNDSNSVVVGLSGLNQNQGTTIQNKINYSSGEQSPLQGAVRNKAGQ